MKESSLIDNFNSPRNPIEDKIVPRKKTRTQTSATVINGEPSKQLPALFFKREQGVKVDEDGADDIVGGNVIFIPYSESGATGKATQLA